MSNNLLQKVLKLVLLTATISEVNVRRTNERKKVIIFHLDKILYLLYAGSKDLKWSLIPGSNPGGRDPSFSRGFKLQSCSGFKPSAYEDPNLVTKCLGSKHNYT